MSSKTQTNATKEEAKPALVPKLRFPQFRAAKDWEMTPLEKCLDYQQPTPYLVKDDRYNPAFKTPVLTAGKTFILGYTNEEYGIFSEGLPVIIFDDFTTATQFVDFPFKAKSSAMKILEAKNGADIKFMYEALQNVAFEVGAHERHWISTFAPMLVPIPQPAEQLKIAECLSSVDELMAAQARKVDALKTHKKGLMQQLFPREGETQPRLRFPEFQNAGEWEEGKLISLSSEPLSNGVFNDPKRVGTGYKLINVSDMYIETTIDESRLSLLELSPSEFEGNQALTGDIFFTRSSLVKSGIAVSNIYLGSSSDVTYDGHLIRFKANTSKVIPLFAHYLFKTALIRAQLIARGKTATMTTIGQADVASVTLFYPDKDEQQRIATSLSSLDALITAETQKHEALKTHKKALMQKLFPSPEEVEA
ncbi:MAG: hypothetical protein RL015_464 [Verrucomicrobiota bacterium]|jgi:type I restriction enzyme S subunit